MAHNDDHTHTSAGALPALLHDSGLDAATLIDYYRQMVLIRRFEEKCQEMYTKARIGGFLHLYIGEEATAVGAISALRPEDHIFTHYRDHGHAIARGLDINALMAELFGKVTGCSKGLGGSMHFADAGKNFWGGYAIVGSHLPLAVGVALGMKMQRRDSVVMVFFGDGATNGGEFYESLNFAQLWRLPVIFVCENNLYAMGTPLEVHSSVTEIYRKACAFDMKAERVDGNDVLVMRDAALRAVEHARSGRGPVLIEAMTYRFRGHSAQDTQKYRSKEDIERHRRNDPIARFRATLVQEGIATEQQLRDIDRMIDDQVEAAVRFADESPEPGHEWITQAGVYAAPIAVNPPIHGE
ncbi:pyruvate dehydrogenase (acetyl-transferring) E1 component subunit alpha [Roseiflexus sp.]|uniref:pyruvate dehydrogenase (acetyl-transferring) E1 component subunit alpha n=1 Tax=Roseiflexus sp. TaxID=2562120 RepID=UPI0021DEB28B|nr:pyruvate dehydrogenase (acetyl-transferring) E1 component subunit alpha [Roseiflexus sp.]GIW01011.1 MAG: pyruvate dehydrogenase E1 component subunit alpha [Roseiflexus sp.]